MPGNRFQSSKPRFQEQNPLALSRMWKIELREGIPYKAPKPLPPNCVCLLCDGLDHCSPDCSNNECSSDEEVSNECFPDFIPIFPAIQQQSFQFTPVEREPSPPPPTPPPVEEHPPEDPPE